MIDPKNKTFEYAVTILESHLDTFGHVNNAVYLQLFEQARWDFITKNGYGLKRIQETGKGPTILEINIRFKREIKLRTQIIIKTQTSGFEGKIGTIHQWMESVNPLDGAVIVHSEATFKIGLFDVRERKLIAPTDEWLKAVL